MTPFCTDEGEPLEVPRCRTCRHYLIWLAVDPDDKTRCVRCMLAAESLRDLSRQLSRQARGA